MNKILLLFLFITLQGCLHQSNPYHEVKYYNPNLIIGLKPKFTSLKGGPAKIENQEITFVSSSITTELISTHEYFKFLKDISKDLVGNELKDSISSYLNVERSTITIKDNVLHLPKGEGKKAMTFVTYFGAKSYCDWLTNKHSKNKNRPAFRLPSEYEWINALNQNKIHKNEKLKEWVTPSKCIVAYQPLTVGFCEHDWMISSLHAHSDSTTVIAINNAAQKSYTTTGESKTESNSFIGFRVIQTQPFKANSGYDF